MFDGYMNQFLTMDKVVVANPLWNLQVPICPRTTIGVSRRSGLAWPGSPAAARPGPSRGLAEGYSASLPLAGRTRLHRYQGGVCRL